MSVRIRLARMGKKNAPVYRIVAADQRQSRDGKFLENLGTYNPKTKKLVQLHTDRVQHWLSVGAVPTDTVKRLYKEHTSKDTQPAAKKAAKA